MNSPSRPLFYFFYDTGKLVAHHRAYCKTILTVNQTPTGN